MRLRGLIVAKTYPTPSRKGVEVSCTQAITDQGRWIRLFPVPFRLLAHARRFRKYQWVEVDAEKARDPRPESYSIDPDTIEILSQPLPTKGDWALRKEIVYPLRSESVEILDQARERSGTSLGFLKPRHITKLIIEPTEPDWTPRQKAKLAQLTLLDKPPYRVLEKIPFHFKYVFSCDDPQCKGHTMTVLDWEIAQSFRNWKNKYGEDWEEKLRYKYERWMIEERDTHFFVGTHSRWHHRWMITGLFYPPL